MNKIDLIKMFPPIDKIVLMDWLLATWFFGFKQNLYLGNTNYPTEVL